MIDKLHDTSKTTFCRPVPSRGRDGQVDPVLILFHCETRFQRSGYVNYQNERFPVLMHEVPIHRNKFGM